MDTDLPIQYEYEHFLQEIFLGGMVFLIKKGHTNLNICTLNAIIFEIDLS